MNSGRVGLGLGARGLKDKDWGPGVSDPYVVISRPSVHGGFQILRTSEVKKNSLNPDWNDFLFSEEELNGGDENLKVKFEIFDDDGKKGPDGKDKLLATGYFSLKQLEAAHTVNTPLEVGDGKKGKSAGHLVVRSVTRHQTPGGGIAAPGGGYPAPGGGYPAPGGGYPAQGGGYPAPGGGYPAPGVGYPAPGGGYPAPAGGYPAPGGGYPAPGGGYPAPGGGYPPAPSAMYPPAGGPGYSAQPGYPAQPGGAPYPPAGGPGYPGAGGPGYPGGNTGFVYPPQ